MDAWTAVKADSSATSRRALLLGGASFAAWAYLPKFARAADGRDPRLVVVILRGALDGLATVAPVGDPDYAGLHGSIALTAGWPACRARCSIRSSRCIRRCRNLRGCIARSMRPWFMRSRRPIATARISTARTCSRAALPGRAGCSPAGSTARWKRCRTANACAGALAVGPTTPLVLRGAAPTVGWAPVALPQADDDTAMRLVELYSHRDPALASALSQGLQLEKAAQGDDMKPKPGTNSARRDAAGGARRGQADGGR